MLAVVVEMLIQAQVWPNAGGSFPSQAGLLRAPVLPNLSWDCPALGMAGPAEAASSWLLWPGRGKEAAWPAALGLFQSQLPSLLPCSTWYLFPFSQKKINAMQTPPLAMPPLAAGAVVPPPCGTGLAWAAPLPPPCLKAVGAAER